MTINPYRPIPEPVRPSVPRFKVTLVVVIVSAALALFTGRKLHVMAGLRGMRPGYPQRTMIVGGDVRRYQDGARVIALFDPANPNHAPYEIQVQPDGLGDFREHSDVRVRCVEEDHECYGATSVYIDDGNFSFDQGLLALECIMLFLSGLRLGAMLFFYLKAFRHYRVSVAAASKLPPVH